MVEVCLAERIRIAFVFLSVQKCNAKVQKTAGYLKLVSVVAVQLAKNFCHAFGIFFSFPKNDVRNLFA